MTKHYNVEQFKDFVDFYIKCNVRFVDEWRNGIALVQLNCGQTAIFNGHNNKGYIIDSKATKDWIRNQFEMCVAKFAPKSFEEIRNCNAIQETSMQNIDKLVTKDI